MWNTAWYVIQATHQSISRSAQSPDNGTVWQPMTIPQKNRVEIHDHLAQTQ